MPGIVGIVSKNLEFRNPKALTNMLSSMAHEATYNQGTMVDDEFGLSIGWLVHKGSFSDCLPIWNKRREAALILIGEIFPSDDAIIQEGYSSPINSAELIEWYDGDEKSFISRLNGWFGGVLLDFKRKCAWLFNDRFGLHRIFFFESNDAFYFASEAKAILRVNKPAREFDVQSAAEVVSFGCTLQNRTLFKNIRLVPQGALWQLEDGMVSVRDRYFDHASWLDQARLPRSEFYQGLKEVFQRVVPRYLYSSEKLGMSLTGGLDTRMILAYSKLPPRSVECYSFGGMYNECYDVSISKQLARICEQNHRLFEVGIDFLTQFSVLAERTVYLSDGGMDVTGSADLYVNQLAKDISATRLTGNYGSEILRGARHLKATAPAPGLFCPEFASEVKTAAETMDQEWQGHPVFLAAFKQVPWHHYNRLSVEQSQLTIRSPYLDNDLIAYMFKAPEEVLTSSDLSFWLVEQGYPALGNIRTDRGLLRSSNDLGTKSIHAYREFLFKADYAFNYGMPQWLAAIDRALLSRLHIERLFLGRHKFHHFRIWFRDQLSSYISGVLLDQRSLERGYLDRKVTQRIVSDHICGKRNYTTEITKLLTFELLHRQFIDE